MMSAIEDGAMQDKAMTQIDELVKELRFGDVDDALALNCADALEVQASELARLRERNAELENTLKLHAGDCMSLSNEIEQMRRNSEDDVGALVRANDRIASLEATVREMREALSLAECVYRKNAVAVGEPSSVLEAMQAALASSESVVGKIEGEKDGE